MKKLNILFYIVFAICFLIAIYIVCDKFLIKKDNVVTNFNEDEEIALLNSRLSEVGSPLGWIIIVDGINNQDDGKYNVTYGKNLLDNYSYRQLFTMEYILSYNNNYDKFIVLDMNSNKIDDLPTNDFTTSYMKYDEFNNYYKLLFGDDFDISKAKKGNTKYDKDYVYYENRRAGSNGVYVSMIQTDNVKYKDGEYISDVSITYSTRASQLLGVSTDVGILKYTKDINDNINFKSFALKGR